MEKITSREHLFMTIGGAILIFLAVMTIGLIISCILHFIGYNDFKDNLGTTLTIAETAGLGIVFIMLIYIPEIAFAKPIKTYNQICDSAWRKELLALGFIEGTKEINNSANKTFTFKGLYKNIPFTIGSQDYSHQYIEIEIPLVLNSKGDESFDKFCEELSHQYKEFGLLLKEEKISVKIPTNEDIKSEKMWSLMDKLIEIASQKVYYEQKIIDCANNNL